MRQLCDNYATKMEILLANTDSLPPLLVNKAPTMVLIFCKIWQNDQ